jgi:hypothetical protein
MNKAFEEILDKLNQVPNEFRHEEYNEAIRDVVNFIERYKEKNNNGWIPCSERLPRDYEEVLADVRGIGFDSLKDAEMVGYFKEKGKWFYSHGMQYLVDGGKTRVIAWQPLPEPFKER